MFTEMNRMPFLNNQNAMFLCGSKKKNVFQNYKDKNEKMLKPIEIL